MIAAYLIVTLLAAAANIFSAACDFVRYKQVSISAVSFLLYYPLSWLVRNQPGTK